MKKSMKKFMVACAAASAIAVAAGMSAMAAEVTYDAENNSAPITVPADAAAGTQKTVLVIPETAKNNVTDNDILYIDQGETLPANALLKAGTLAEGKYLVMVGYYKEGGEFAISDDYFTIGSDVPPAPEYTLGDVNADTEIDSQDALIILEYEVGNTNLTDVQKLAADTNKDNDYDSQDALLILEYEVGNIGSFD